MNIQEIYLSSLMKIKNKKIWKKTIKNLTQDTI